MSSSAVLPAKGSSLTSSEVQAASATPLSQYGDLLTVDNMAEVLDVSTRTVYRLTDGGEGFSLELIRRYGIRVSELGDYSMEYDLKTPEQQAEVANVVRFAVDRSRLTQEHLDYVIAAVKALYEDRENIPNMRIVWGHKLPMRHFHAFLEPYPNE